jgi:hypothetical protein
MNTKLPNVSIVHKGGKYLIQEDGKKGEESTFISLVLESETGKNWLIKNKITEKTPKESESPDYLFTNSQGETIGIEIVKLLIKTDKFQATARLKTIANKVVQHFKKEKDIALSVLIDVYDKRKWSVDWNEHLDACYNPGFSQLEVSDKQIKDAIIEAITKEGIPEFGLKKVNVAVPPHTFIVTYDNVFFSPHTLSVQQAYVAEFEREQAIAAANRELIGMMERKIENTLSELWEG